MELWNARRATHYYYISAYMQIDVFAIAVNFRIGGNHVDGKTAFVA